MKAEKMTARWYDDACGTAMAMELVGERWSLLIVRELLFGMRRFGELKAALSGISANVLTQRLSGLEAAGIVRRRMLPSPSSAQVYELTAWGKESERAIMELGRWATRSPQHDPSLPLSAASLMMSFRTMFDAESARGTRATLGMRLGKDAFVLRVGARGLDIRREEPEDADVVVEAETPMAVAAVVYGGAPLRSLRIAGDTTLAKRFTSWFPMPEKAT